MTDKELNELKVADIIRMPEFREEVDRQLTIEQDAYSKAVMDAKDKGCTLKRFPMLNLRDKGVLNADKMVDEYAMRCEKAVFDLRQISVMDSTGIGFLIGRYKKFSRYGVAVYLTNPSQATDRILQMSGLYTLMPRI